MEEECVLPPPTNVYERRAACEEKQSMFTVTLCLDTNVDGDAYGRLETPRGDMLANKLRAYGVRDPGGVAGSIPPEPGSRLEDLGVRLEDPGARVEDPGGPGGRSGCPDRRSGIRHRGPDYGRFRGPGRGDRERFFDQYRVFFDPEPNADEDKQPLDECRHGQRVPDGEREPELLHGIERG